jgi:hypothetical protein
MKKYFFLLLLSGLFVTNVFAQTTNGEAIRSTALLVQRWNDWSDRCQNFWDSQCNLQTKIFVGGIISLEDWKYQLGAYAGIAIVMSDLVDKCISLNLRSLEPESYRWLTTSNSEYFYKQSLKYTSWISSHSADQKEIFDMGFSRGNLSIDGRSARLPNIWDWRYGN